MLAIFKKMKEEVYRKVTNSESGLYVAIVFPIVFAFLLTFVLSRFISYLITYHYIPEIYLQPSPGLHVHHFTYGVFIMAVAGYLALVFNGPRAKFAIALLLGLGLGLAFDEFGMWLKLRDDNLTRWSYDGFNIVIGFFFLLISTPKGYRLLKRVLNWKN